MNECPRCGSKLASRVRVCRHCLHIVDRERWRHDAGRLGADGRGSGHPLEDQSVGPLPLTGGGLVTGASSLGAAGALNGIARLVGALPPRPAAFRPVLKSATAVLHASNMNATC